MKWKVAAREVTSPMPHPASYIYCNAMVGQITGGKTYPIVLENRDRTFKFCIDPAGYEEEGRQVLKRLEDPQFLETVDKSQRESVKALLDYSRRLRDRNFSSAGNKELAEAYDKQFGLFLEMNKWGIIINAADFEHFMLSNKIMAFLEKAIRERNLKVNKSDAFSTLITPEERSKLQQQDYDLYKILAAIRADEKTAELFSKETKEIMKSLDGCPTIRKAVSEHAGRYDWMQYHYDGPAILGEEYFVEVLASQVRQGVNGREKLQEMDESEEQTHQRKQELLEQLQLDEDERYWLKVAETFMFLKPLRKEAVFEASRCSEGLLREIGKRLNLSRVQVRHLMVEEVAEALETRQLDVNELNERVKLSIWTVTNEGERKVFTGKKAEAYSTQIYEDEVPDGITELKGTPAFVGKARGTVRIILGAEDMAKMNEGDILVAPATNPNIVTAMKKAAAIITDEGGVTCHAAIVSRELKIPCVIGTKIATRWLKDGDVVEVDATAGIVRKI